MRKAKLFIALLRMVLGWLFLYQGVIAIVHSDWSVGPYIQNARSFSWLYSIVNTQPLLQYVSYGVKGLFILVGALLILGIGARFAAFLGIALMLFFYFPLLSFPHVFSLDGSSVYYIVDDHIVYVMILLYLFTVRSGEYLGLGSLFRLSKY